MRKLVGPVTDHCLDIRRIFSVEGPLARSGLSKFCRLSQISADQCRQSEAIVREVASVSEGAEVRSPENEIGNAALLEQGGGGEQEVHQMLAQQSGVSAPYEA
jgi:hypothetical protein